MRAAIFFSALSLSRSCPLGIFGILLLANSLFGFMFFIILYDYYYIFRRMITTLLEIMSVLCAYHS